MRRGKGKLKTVRAEILLSVREMSGSEPYKDTGRKEQKACAHSL